SRFLGVPYSVTAHAYEIFQHPANLADKLNAAALVTSGCDYNVEHLRALPGVRAGARIEKVIMGVDPDAFRRSRPYPGTGRVVATDEVGLPEVVRPPWGVLVPPHDPEALADAIAEILARSLDERRAMGAAGRAFVSESCNVHGEARRLEHLLTT